ncbi:MAG: RsmB/NOP family class I SAM-dependent RNA methyltransferase [Candidatus Anstonellales archaeon]
MEEKEFREWLSSYTDADKCMEAFKNRKKFFRVNTIKIGLEEFEKVSMLERKATKVKGAFEYLGEGIGRTFDYFLGYIHPQSLSSIMVSEALAPKAGEVVLDAAAAPGSKLTHMAALMENKGAIVGIELKGHKLGPLFDNISRLGVINACIIVGDSTKFKKRMFGKALVDAPCTALGSGGSAYLRWEPQHSKRISVLQEKMLLNAYDCLLDGGELVYSTCTYPPEENEKVVARLLEEREGASLIEVPLEGDGGISEYGKEMGKCRRIYPQQNNSEGFFIAKVKKYGEG